jgi:hypothetical protein
LIGFADQPGQRLGVGLGDEDVALGLETRAEGPVVLDDAVMDERDASTLPTDFREISRSPACRASPAES